MNRRPTSPSAGRAGVLDRDTTQPSTNTLPIGVWYVAIIAVLLLIAAGIYIVFLHQQRLQWRDAANQMSIGQEFLRADRDELLQKTQEHEAELTVLERQLSTRDLRLASLRQQRQELQADITLLTQDLADAKRQRNASSSVPTADRQSVEGESSRLSQELVEKDKVISEHTATIARLEGALIEADELLVKSQSKAREQETLATEMRLEKAAHEERALRSREELVLTRQAFRRGQIIRGHNASLGEVKPYLAEVGPEYWQVIEGWLEQQLQRSMMVPNLSTIGWSYEGARLLVTTDGPPMVMLLYADQRGKPVSFTIAQDSAGERPAMPMLEAGLNLLEWRDDRHAFVLAGEADEVVLQVVASALQDQSNKVASNSTVPSGRFFRPEFRPDTL